MYGIATLVEYLDTDVAVHREAARRGLAALDGPGVHTTLADLLKHDRDENWRFAMAELERRRDRWTIFPLIDLSRAGTPERQRAAAEALRRAGILEVGDFLLTALDDPGLRKHAIRRVETGPRTIEPLLRVLADQNIDYCIRAEAAGQLGRIEDRRAVPGLCAVLEYHDSDPFGHVPRAAAHALMNIGDPAALPALRAAYHPEDSSVITHDDDYAQSAKDAAGIIGAAIYHLERTPAEPEQPPRGLP